MSSRPRQALAIVGAAVIVSALVGWLVTDRLEGDNDFCNACHLESTVPLHVDIRRDFDASPAVSLAGAHGIVTLEAGAARAFRCIDCHGGVSFPGRARVKALAAQDAFRYVVGRFEEPSEMRWPLWDEDCLQCHPSFDTREPAEWETPRFHQLPVHNTELGVSCVECHRVHDAGGDPDADFLHATWVRSQCQTQGKTRLMRCTFRSRFGGLSTR